MQTPARLATVAVSLLAVLGTEAAEEDYSKQGPYSSSVFKFDKVPVEEKRTVPVTITLPNSVAPNSIAQFQGPYPVIIFLNGFECTPCLYRPYADRLASWGFAVVQYKGPIVKWHSFPFITDAEEETWIDPVLDFLGQKNNDSTSPLHNCLKLETVGMAGHSRGGKLTALQYAGNPRIKAAYLIDPADSTNCSNPKCSADYPNAVKRVAGKRLAIAGAGATGRCDSDCTGVYYQHYFGNASAGSVLYTIANAGHFSFTKPFHFSDLWKCPQGQIVKTLGQPACNGLKKTLDGSTTIELTVTTMLAWFDAELRGRTQPPDSYAHWLQKQQDKGLLSVEINSGHGGNIASHAIRSLSL